MRFSINVQAQWGHWSTRMDTDQCFEKDREINVFGHDARSGGGGHLTPSELRHQIRHVVSEQTAKRTSWDDQC